ncbi:arf-GAP with coiled-coil, ANK repeat and PH domain-containing protein 1 [Morone saxatilis]|uniref:arf-GAP with coiled-coil, ANK repeat and PH domain-containing protein 1 n=1 Tax=Morone saxatilis TaxID=34816 RepID=UPI0015E23726|nr:arf-GAP with coiled-coil, ANK repeat and PH domain-containing protein 1 [Morone saxatilis]
MTVKLDFEECLKDSPRFRAEIEVVQNDVSELETRLDKLVKQCQAMLEAGRAYCQSSKSFVNGLRELGHHCSGDKMMEECLDKFSKKLSVILDAQGEVIETTQKSVKTKLQTFVKEDVRRFKDVRKEFERSSECLEGAQARNAQAPRGKQHEVEEASNALLNARKAFRSEALDYVLEINVIEAKKKTDILMAILSLMEAQAQFFQQGHQSLSELDEYRRKLNEEHTQFVLNSAREKRDMEQRHAAIKKKDVSYDDSIMDFNADAANGIAMEGYLYKRASNAFKTWSRRWFSIQKNQLVYQKKFKDQPTVVVEDLRLCTVKPSAENERRFCFEVVSPSKNTQLMCELGNTVINRIYEARIDEITIKKPHPSSPRGDKESWIKSKYVEKKFIQKLPETGRNPVLRRSSARRNRATTQDRTVQRPPLKPKPNRATLPRVTGLSPSDLLQKNNTGFHKDEDEEEEDLSGLHPGALLYRSAALQNFPVMADALAHGADVNWVNVAEDSSTPLIQAVTANALAACEFLLQNSANVNQADSNGRGPLHHATILGHTGLVCLFLKRGADYNARDKNQKDPITIAVDNANADIVTLLRIAKMNKEMREMDGAFGQPGDETYQDIFRDFSHMASNNPEKLKRRSADPKT